MNNSICYLLGNVNGKVGEGSSIAGLLVLSKHVDLGQQGGNPFLDDAPYNCILNSVIAVGKDIAE